MLKIGSKAPDFKISNDRGEEVSLKDFKGQKVVLFFYPKDMTSGCTKEACDFNEALGQFKKLKTAVLGISRDSVERHQKFKNKYGLQFPLLSDEEGDVCGKYGVWQEKSLYGRKFMGIVRTTIVIDELGKVLKIYPKVKVAGHVDQILKDKIL